MRIKIIINKVGVVLEKEVCIKKASIKHFINSLRENGWKIKALQKA